MNFIIIVITFSILAVVILLLLKKKPKKQSYGVSSVTLKGETVRSKSEKIIADYLFENEIPYIYEKTIELGKEKHKIKYDFYLPDYDIYIEYWGMESVKGKDGDQYRARKAEKIELYDRYNLKLISISPDDLKNLDTYLPAEIKKLSNKKANFKVFSEKLKVLLFGVTSKRKVEHMYCPKCGTEMEENGFCTNCGFKDDNIQENQDDVVKNQLIFCDKCGTKIEGFGFCPNCGNEITP